MYLQLIKKHVLILGFLTVLGMEISQGADGKWYSSDMIRSYQQKEQVVFDKYTRVSRESIKALFESRDFKENYEKERKKNGGNYRPNCNKLIEQCWANKVKPIKMESLSQGIPYKELLGIGGINYTFYTTLILEGSRDGFYGLTGAFQSLTDPRENVEKHINAVLQNRSEFWNGVIKNAKIKEDQDVAEAQKKERQERFPQQLILANQGDPGAQNQVGFSYYNGEGVNKDVRAAREWFEKSAAQGNWHSMTWLAQIYYNSEGGTYEEGPLYVRRSAALKWYRRTADHGWEPAKGWIDKITEEARIGGYWHLIEGVPAAAPSAMGEKPQVHDQEKEKRIAKLKADLNVALNQKMIADQYADRCASNRFPVPPHRQQEAAEWAREITKINRELEALKL